MPFRPAEINDLEVTLHQSPIFQFAHSLYTSKRGLNYRYGVNKNLDEIVLDAVKYGSLPDVKACIRLGVSLETFKKALAVSSYYNRTNIADFLLTNLPNELVANKPALLKNMLLNAKSAEMANLLKQNGAPTLTQNDLTSRLFYAVKKAHASLVQWLCQQGADVDAIETAPGVFSGNSKYTPLMWAVYGDAGSFNLLRGLIPPEEYYEQYKPIVELLCRFGATITKETLIINNGQEVRVGSAIDIALINKNQLMADLLEKQMILQAEKEANTMLKATDQLPKELTCKIGDFVTANKITHFFLQRACYENEYPAMASATRVSGK